jgi:hypothetical protein
MRGVKLVEAKSGYNVSTGFITELYSLNLALFDISLLLNTAAFARLA